MWQAFIVSLRLHRNPQGNTSGDFAFRPSPGKPGVGYTCSLQAMSCVSRALPDLHHAATRAAKQCSRFSHFIGARGGPGGSSVLASPRRLYAAFDARKRLPRNKGKSAKQPETAVHRRLPVTFRTALPTNFGSRMHTILTRMLSPPASADQRPPCTDERRARHRRPGPARDAQEQQQQPSRDEHAAQQPPQPILHQRTLCRIVRQIPDFSHPASPASLAGYAALAPRMHHLLRARSKKFGKMTILLQSTVYNPAVIV